MTPTIEITIDETGNSEIEVKGSVGPSCSNLTKAIEQALGTTTSDVKKPEFHRQQSQGETARH